MSAKTTPLPDGLAEHPPDWHFDRFVEFTDFKAQVGEPSPHLALVGHMGRDATLEQRVWMLGCYAAVYCLPTSQVIWTVWPWPTVRQDSAKFCEWISDNWKGMVTRTERRCIRTPDKLGRCLLGYAEWAEYGFPTLPRMRAHSAPEYYDKVWDSVCSVPFIGRYIGIRLIEGLRRYCGVPACLYDIRSIGGWSPKKALVYFYPEHAELLLTDSKEGNETTDQLARHLLARVQVPLPQVDSYVLAAMLCEYRGYFENRRQYPGWTIDQEPLLYDKVKAYWGDQLQDQEFWDARRALFPAVALGESEQQWHGTRWDLTKTLRDHGYVWGDTKLCFAHSKDHLDSPARWENCLANHTKRPSWAG